MLEHLYELAQPLLSELTVFKQIVLSLLSAIIGLVILLRGRKTYWFFIGMVGFIIGIYLGFRFVSADGWLRWLLILGMGLLFMGLSRLAQKMMVTLAAALALFGIGYVLPPINWPDLVRYLCAVLLGLIGAYLALRVFDWALIIGSAILGAWLINGALPIIANLAKLPTLSGNTLTMVLLGLILVGIAVQAFGLPKRSRL
ncbi:MAG: hypothetical protein LLG44_00290 [Chloroflexi bacterium]|nr:hypothetical protein [Chloroflexota bacterium]